MKQRILKYGFNKETARYILQLKEGKLCRIIKRVYGEFIEFILRLLKILKYYNHKFFNISYLKKGLVDNPSNINEDFHNKIIERIIIAYHKSKKEQKKVDLSYQLGGEWKELLPTKAYFPLTSALENKRVDKVKEILQNFCRVSSKGLYMSSYFSDLNNKFYFDYPYFYLAKFCEELNIWNKYGGKTLDKLNFPRVGNPFGMKIKESLIPVHSFEEYYFSDKLINLSTNMKKPIICEIGGGFGWLAYYLLNQNKEIKYIDLDLPEIIVIASYFLMMSLPNETFRLFGESNSNQRIILLPNFELLKLKDKSVDIFFNCNSLTEMDDFTVKEYIKQISRICKKYFIHSNHDDTKVYDESGKRHIQVSKLSLPTFTKIYSSPMPFNKYNYEYLYEKIHTDLKEKAK